MFKHIDTYNVKSALVSLRLKYILTWAQEKWKAPDDDLMRLLMNLRKAHDSKEARGEKSRQASEQERCVPVTTRAPGIVTDAACCQ